METSQNVLPEVLAQETHEMSPLEITAQEIGVSVEEIIEMDYDNTLDILAEKYKHLIVPEYPRCIHCGEESLKGNYCSNCGCKLIK